MTTSRALTCALGMAQLLCCPTAEASPADLFGVGARPQGMAQTGAAHGEHDHQSTINPALLGGRTEQHLSLGYQSALFRTSYRTDFRHEMQESVNSTLLGVTLPLPFGGGLEERLALGFSALSPRELVTRAQLWFPERPQFPLLAPRAQTLSLTAGLGVEVTENLRVGLGIRWLAGLVASVMVSGADDETTSVVRDELVTSTGLVIGVQAEPSEHLHLGLVWREAHQSELDVAITLSDVGALVLPPLNVTGIPEYDPEQVDLELAWVDEHWQLSLATRFRRWAAFPGFLGQTVVCPAGEERCGTEPPAKPGFTNTWSPRAGAAYRIPLRPRLSAELRAGMAYEPSPVPEQSRGSNTWDNARWVASLGYGLEFQVGGVPLDLELSLQQHWLTQRTHQKLPEFAEQEPALATVHTGGQIQLVALSFGVAF